MFMQKYDYREEVGVLTGSGVYLLSEQTISEFMKLLDDTIYKVTQDGDYYVEVIQERFNKVVVLDKDYMGEGEKKLGRILMKSFLTTIRDCSLKPEKILFYNEAVRLSADDEFVPILKELQESGVDLLLCGTCIKYFEIEYQVGKVSNMFSILGVQMNSNQVIKP